MESPLNEFLIDNSLRSKVKSIFLKRQINKLNAKVNINITQSLIINLKVERSVIFDLISFLFNYLFTLTTFIIL